MLRSALGLALVLTVAPTAQAQEWDAAWDRGRLASSTTASFESTHPTRVRRRDHGLIAGGATLFFAAYITTATLGALFDPLMLEFVPMMPPVYATLVDGFMGGILTGLTVLETIGFVLWVAGDVAHTVAPVRLALGGAAGITGFTISGCF